MYPTFIFCGISQKLLKLHFVMARQKNDGRGRLGGRQKGTPNKENPLKGFLRAHSYAYFEPKPQTEEDGTPRKLTFRDEDGVIYETIPLVDASGNPRVMSDFDVDMMILDANERITAELRLLEYHTPKMKSVDVDMNVNDTAHTIEDKLRELSGACDQDDE